MDKLEQLINNQVKDWSLDQEFYKNKEIFDLSEIFISAFNVSRKEAKQ